MCRASASATIVTKGRHPERKRPWRSGASSGSSSARTRSGQSSCTTTSWCGATGRSTLDEVDDDLIESFDFSTGGVAWIRENEEHFTPLVAQVPEIPGT